MAKKEKLPKYVINKFKKPQFKLGDTVIYTFLGEKGYGKITNIKNEKTDKYISYTVKGNGYKYPCGLRISKYKSYQFGYILFEETSEYKRSIKQPRRQDPEIANDIKCRGRISTTISGSISEQSRSGFSEKNIIGDIDTKDITTDGVSRKTDKTTSELESAIEKQKKFLRGKVKK